MEQITWNYNPDEPIDLIQNIKDGFEASIKAHKDYEAKYLNPCWQLEWCYLVSPRILKMLEEGLIEERDIPLYALEARQVWKNVCEDE